MSSVGGRAWSLASSLLATSLACTPSLTLRHRPRGPASSSLRLDGILSGVNARTFDLTIPFLGDCLTVWVPREVSMRRGSVQPCLNSRRETVHQGPGVMCCGLPFSRTSFSPHCAHMEACLQRVGKGKKRLQLCRMWSNEAFHFPCYVFL